MPRACSSGSRSVSLPVSARTSHVLPWSMWPAVPTVSGMRARRPRPRRPRASASVRQSSSRRPSRTIPTTGGSCRRSGSASDSSTAHANDGSSASGSAPPPTRADRLLDLAADRRREPLGARPHDGGVLAQHPQHRHLAQRARGLEVEEQRPLERREGELVDAQRALQRMAAQPSRRDRRGRRRCPPAGRRAACRR